MAKRTGDLFPAVIGGGAILLALFIHSIYEDLLKAAVLKRLSASMDVPEAELISRLTEMAVPIIGAVAVVWIVLRYARREFQAGIPDPLLEAQRQHTAAVIAHTEALKSKLQNVESPAAAIGAVVLAGIVNALMERALQYGFKMAKVDPNDPFTQLYQDVKNSIDPVWTDDETGSLRADFLQYCAIVGSDYQDANEFRSDRAKLHGFGKRLIAKLKGLPVESPPADSFDWKSAPEAVELFAESALLAERDKQSGDLEKTMLRRFDAEDKIKAILKALPDQRAVEGTEEFKKIENYNWMIRANERLEGIIQPYIRQAWDALREDIHMKLKGGKLTAKGFSEPHVSGASEVEISPAEWRILSLDNVNSTALRNGEVVYSGLLIRSVQSA